jgi:hypothetical protein
MGLGLRVALQQRGNVAAANMGILPALATP